MAGEKILIVDDEKKICELIRSYLVKEGFSPSCVYTGTEALESVRDENPDLIILDFMLPDIEGPELCLLIRKISNAPVLFLSCRANEIDKIVSLSSGGDDYITKPFLPGELIAKIKAHLRRSRVQEQEQSSEEPEGMIHAGALTIHPQLRTVTRDSEPVSLTAKEFDILLLLAQNPKRIFSAEQLFKIVWKTTNLSNDPKTVAVHISALRKKISSPDIEYVINIRNVGYKFNHELLDAEK